MFRLSVAMAAAMEDGNGKRVRFSIRSKLLDLLHIYVSISPYILIIYDNKYIKMQRNYLNYLADPKFVA